VEDERLASIRRRRILIGLIVVLIILLVPIPSTVVPAWRIRIVDQEGGPVTNINVRQHWQHYSFQAEGREIDARPDPDGYVSFPRRVAWAGALPRLLGPVLNVVTLGVHASFGPTAAVQAWNAGYEGWVDYKGEPQPPESLMVHKRDMP